MCNAHGGLTAAFRPTPRQCVACYICERDRIRVHRKALWWGWSCEIWASALRNRGLGWRTFQARYRFRCCATLPKSHCLTPVVPSAHTSAGDCLRSASRKVIVTRTYGITASVCNRERWIWAGLHWKKWLFCRQYGLQSHLLLRKQYCMVQLFSRLCYGRLIRDVSKRDPDAHAQNVKLKDQSH